jgi:hypothetical protein
VTGLEFALRMDVIGARDALGAVLGDVQLIEEDCAVCAECDNAAERLLLAVGDVSMGTIARGRNRTRLPVRAKTGQTDFQHQALQG